MWRFEFERPDIMLAVKCGGLANDRPGRTHQRAARCERDPEKDAEAMQLGWRSLRITAGTVRSDAAYRYIGG